MIGVQKQLALFLICVMTGMGNGLIYEAFDLIRRGFRCHKGKARWLAILLDILFCLAFAMVCQIVSVAFHFPDLRLYMLCGYALGFIIYLKSLHRIVAFLKKVCYNTLVRLLKSLKARKKLFQEVKDI